MSLKVEILYINDCPGYALTLAAVNEVIAQSHFNAQVRSIEVSDPDTPGFAGSPTVRVNGKDIDRRRAAACCGLTCRTYCHNGALKNFPSREMIATAFRQENQSAVLPPMMAPLVAMTTALASVACCLPYGIAGVLGSFGLSLYFESHRGLLLGISVIALLLQAMQLYRSHSVVGKILFGMALAIVAAMLFIPDRIALWFTKLS